ncbi:MAG: hypothetical protein ACI8O8_002421 [Oleiphilaceae bacterium]
MLSGCVLGLNSMQKREYAAMKLDNVMIEEKNPSLGLLPGFGSFYARKPGYGILNLLLWPASILWDPISGHQGSEAINYELTKHYLKKQQESAIAALDDKLMTKELDSSEYVQEKNKIEQKYSY